MIYSMSVLVCDWISWLIDCLVVRTNKRTNERTSERANEQATSERANEQAPSERANEYMEGMNLDNELNEWLIESMNKHTHTGTNYVSNEVYWLVNAYILDMWLRYDVVNISYKTVSTLSDIGRHWALFSDKKSAVYLMIRILCIQVCVCNKKKSRV